MYKNDKRGDADAYWKTKVIAWRKGTSLLTL